MDSQELRKIIAEVVLQQLQSQTADKIPVGVSNRHLHLSRKDVDQLFGPGYQLTKVKDLSQPGQFAAGEVVSLVGPKGSINGVRILGPERDQTQVEILRSDTFKLGVSYCLRESGDIQQTPGILLVGPKGVVKLKQGVIAAMRHIHMNPTQASEFKVRDKQIVKVQATGERGLVFDNVLVRVHPSFNLECHLDIDEANAADLNSGGFVEIVNG